MQPITAFIVEDEPRSRELLREMLLQYCPGITVSGMAATVPEAVAAIRADPPAVVFLDIMLPGQSGFDLLQQLSPFSFRVIFTTSHENYALQAFRYAAVDYLLKPISITELQEAVCKVAALQPVANTLTAPAREHIALPLANGFEVIRIPDILYCISSNTYTTFYLLQNRPIMVSRTLKECEELLAPSGFYRIHQSHLINIMHLKKYIRGAGGQVVMADSKHLDVSPRKKDLLIAALNRF